MTLDANEEAPGRIDRLPVIDISAFDSVGAEREEFLTELRRAAHEVGFLYIVGHGIPLDRSDALFAAARRFFALPQDVKEQVGFVHSPRFRGYARLGDEYTDGGQDWREQYDIGPDRPAELPDDRPFWRLVGPNPWPAGEPEFRRTVSQWYDAVQGLAQRVLDALGAALGQGDAFFDQWFAHEPFSRLKISHYVGFRRGQHDQGLGSHKDAGFAALVLQDEEGGLQVEVAPGRWVDATPVPGAFVFNIGELLEVATNGYLRATVHRVRAPEPGRERYSVAFFPEPALDAVVPRLALPADLAAEARGVDQDPANPLYAQAGWNTLKSRLRSHPETAERWWSDLLASDVPGIGLSTERTNPAPRVRD